LPALNDKYLPRMKNRQGCLFHKMINLIIGNFLWVELYCSIYKALCYVLKSEAGGKD
jgi:hypothetical protein